MTESSTLLLKTVLSRSTLFKLLSDGEDKLTDEAGNELMSSAVDEAVEQSEEYTNNKASQTLNAAKADTEQKISTYDTQLKYWLTQHYQPL